MACTFDESYPASYGGKRPYFITPPTTDSTLVFSFDRQSKSFDRGFYSPALTDGRLGFQQLDSFLGEAERILKKKIAPAQKVMKLFAFFALAGLAAFFVLFLSMISDDLDSTYDIDNNEAYYDSFDEDEALFVAMLAYLFAVIFYGVLVSLYRRRRYRKAKKAVNALVEKNYPFFAAQGLRWNIPKHFRWIELWKDYRGQAPCACGQMMRPYTNYFIPIQGQMSPQPQYQPYPQQNPQQLQIPYMVQPVPQNPTNNVNFLNRPLVQPLLNQEQNQENAQYVPPNRNNYPSLDD